MQIARQPHLKVNLPGELAFGGRMRSIYIILDGTDLATIDRLSGGRYGLNIPDRQSVISTAVVTSTPARTAVRFLLPSPRLQVRFRGPRV